MASDVQDGGFEIWQKKIIQSFAMSLYFDQQHDPNSYFANLAKNGGSIQDGGSKSVFSITLEVVSIFSICFRIRFLLVKRKFRSKKFSKRRRKKSKMAVESEKTCHIGFFLTFFHKLASYQIRSSKKQIEKILTTSRVMIKN
jgi:hypothetical protein